MKNTIEALAEQDIELNEELGQHILIDARALQLLRNCVIPGANVIEIGTGPGNLTREIAQVASQVYGFEIDRRYTPIIDQLLKAHSNVMVSYTDALNANLAKLTRKDQDESWQVVANIPYHLSEPLITKLIDLQIEDAVLMVGDNLADIISNQNPESGTYSKLSLMAQTHFHVNRLMDISRNSFYPPPKTESAIVRLTPRSQHEFTNPQIAILANVINPQNRGTAVEKLISDAINAPNVHTKYLLTKTDSHRVERRKSKEELRSMMNNYNDLGESGLTNKSDRTRKRIWDIGQLGLSRQVLSKPFFALNNSEIRTLVCAVQKMFPDFT